VGLNLARGHYIGFGSLCDDGGYHGWVLGYDASSLTPTAAFVVTPTGPAGAIWQSGAGLSADPGGNVYAVTGNGTFLPDGSNTSDCVLKLVAGQGSLAGADSFTPATRTISMRTTTISGRPAWC
jgi:hypothetical protein